jgi:hypothetical protein
MSNKYVTLEEFKNYKKEIEELMNSSKKDVNNVIEPKTRKPNNYALYVKQMIPVIKEKYPDISKTDIFKKIAEEWKIKNTKEKESEKEKEK